MRKRARKTVSTTTALPTATSNPNQTPLYKRVWVVASAVGAVMFALGLNGPTILQNLRKMPSEVEATRDQYLSWMKEDEEWTGSWSSFPEGIVNMEDMNLSNTRLKLSLTSKNGELGGEISSPAICRDMPHFDFLLLRGKVSGRTAEVIVWDVVGGKTVEFARLTLERIDGVITVTPKSGKTSWFEDNARIGKHPDAENNFLVGYCKTIGAAQ